MNRIIATHIGSAPQVTSKAFTTPLPGTLKNDYISVLCNLGPAQETGLPSIIDFFAALARLYETYEDVVAVQEKYLIMDGHQLSKILENFDRLRILELDQRLCAWKAALPSHLDRVDDPALQNPIARRQYNILRIRYLHMCLRLWRPFLALTAAFPDICRRVSIADGTQMHRVDTPLTYALAQEGAIKCVLSAHEIIKIITETAPETANSPGHSAGPWWENIEHAFTCATVFVAARLCPLFKQHRGTVSQGIKIIDDGWRRSVRFLQEYSASSTVAAKCVSALDCISGIVLVDDEEDEEPYEDGDDDDGFESRIVRDITWLDCLPADIPD